eukprot:GHVN01068000.1.p1 GENE.GHVN01068000.1~~GHVN01068000.1.p1  ORF type:complete len:161 (+),score=20.92 GHVN01068000.1:277-759(+)
MPALSNKFASAAEAQSLARKTVTKYVAAAKAKYPSCGMIILPEAWSLPYATKYFQPFAEEVPEVGGAIEEKHSSVNLLANLAKKHSVWIVGGSVSETSKDKLFNTSVVLNDTGDIVAKHRKAHLFDIDVPGKITFKESDVLTAGDKVTTFTTPWGILGKR